MGKSPETRTALAGQVYFFVSSYLWVVLHKQIASTSLIYNIYQEYKILFLKYLTWRYNFFIGWQDFKFLFLPCRHAPNKMLLQDSL